MSFARTSVLSFAASLLLAGALLTVPSDAALAPGQAHAAMVGAEKKAAKKPNKGPYRVRPGVTFNNAFGSNEVKRAIIIKVNSAIRHSKPGSTIRIFSWKIYTRAGVSALLAAQKRGVRVRVIMDKKNTVVENNPHFRRLRLGLAEGNKGRPPKMRSAARLCDKSCRGTSGAAHSKFMLFSQSGLSRNVYMQSSANWGDAAANLQWNDMYTFVGHEGIYEAAVAAFEASWKDRPVKGAWTEYATGDESTVVAWSPTDQKSRKEDRLMGTLKRVRCAGATGGAGNAKGRTIIRTAPDVIRSQRGMDVARQLRRLWDKGCDVKIGYTVMGKDVSRLLRGPGRRGPVPMRHLTQDYDGDGIFDRYFHLKAYTVNGVIGRDTEAFWMLTGSANTSGLALVSDEQLVYFIDKRAITKRYQDHISYWIANFPASTPTSRVAARRIATGEVDPYANMELD